MALQGGCVDCWASTKFDFLETFRPYHPHSDGVAKVVLLSVVFVYVCVCLFVCQRDKYWTVWDIIMKFCGSKTWPNARVLFVYRMRWKVQRTFGDRHATRAIADVPVPQVTSDKFCWRAYYLLPTTEEVYAIACDVCLSVCLSVCLCAGLLKNAYMDLDEMLRVDRCRDTDELINFWARSGS